MRFVNTIFAVVIREENIHPESESTGDDWLFGCTI